MHRSIKTLFNLVTDPAGSFLKLKTAAAEYVENSENAQAFFTAVQGILGALRLDNPPENEQLMPIPVESSPDLGSPGGM